MLGVVIGVIAGVIQHFLMARFRGSAGKDKSKRKVWLYAFAQFLLPFAVFVIVGILLPEELLITAIAMAVTLLLSTVLRYLIFTKSEK